MVLPDVNVLIYAFRLESPFHALCNAWLARTIEADAQFGISTTALSGLVRITTNRRLFSEPSTLAAAFRFCEDIVNQANCQLIEPGARHWTIFRRLCEESNVTGSDVTDAWFAALAIEHGCEWITMDRGFVRFAGVNWRQPT